jgi:phenylalanyl-tRNA synthetase beta chain
LAKRALAVRGLREAVTWSFLPRAQAEMFGGGLAELMLANPISSDLDTMRPSLLPNLIAAAGRNVDRGFADLGLFEVGPQYAGVRAEDQAMAATAVRRGMTGARHWSAAPRPVDAYDAKADAEALLTACGAPVANLQTAAEAPAWYHPGRSGVLRLGPKNVLAAFGEIHPGVLEAMDVKGPMVGIEVFLDNIPLPKDKGTRTRPKLDAPDLLPVDRDFAFIVGADVEADQLVRAARGAEKALIADVAVFDVYQGKGVEDGHKSVALTVRLQPRDKTLTDAEIDAVGDKVVAAVAKATGGKLRS